jgi:hypothetical protein
VIAVKLKISFFKSKSAEAKLTSRGLFKKKFALEAIDKSSLATFTTRNRFYETVYGQNLIWSNFDL